MHRSVCRVGAAFLNASSRPRLAAYCAARRPGEGATFRFSNRKPDHDEIRVFSRGGELQGLWGSSAGAILDDLKYDDLVGSAVPEPATWAMMILGFAFSGWSLRRRPVKQFRLGKKRFQVGLRPRRRRNPDLPLSVRLRRRRIAIGARATGCEKRNPICAVNRRSPTCHAQKPKLLVS